MKKIFLSLALVSLTFAAAQKKEIANAVKAVESNDFAGANSQIAAAEGVMGGQTHLLEPALLEQYYYAKGLALLKTGKPTEGAAFLAKINDLGKSKIYTGKDGKNKVYFVGKAAADASGINGLKEENFVPTTSDKLAIAINPLVQLSNKAAIDAYNEKNFAVSGAKFRESYNLLKAAGQINGQLLYNSSLSYVYAKDNEKALEGFSELINSGYTGVQTTYTAKEKATGKSIDLDKATWETLKKSPDYSDFKTEVSPSIEGELYETYASILVEAGKFDDAIAFTEKSLKKFPTSVRLAELQSHSYYKAGKTAEFAASLKSYLSKNPNDATSWYNLGVLQSKDPAQKSEAESAFRKAIELDSKMTNAYQNLAYLMMGDDDITISEYDSLRKAGKVDEANKVMDARRERFKSAIPVVEKWHQAHPDNLDAVTLLKGMYQTTRNEAKQKEFKAKEDALKAKAK